MLDFSVFPEEDLWQKLKNKGSAVIYGTGDGADKIIDRLNCDGVDITAVCCTNDFIRNKNKKFRGYDVISVSDCIKKYPDEIFLLSFGSKLESVIENIKKISEKVKLFEPSVPVYGDDIFDIAYLEKHKAEITEAYDLLSDDISRYVFANAINFYLTGELKYIFDSDTDKSEAFNNILKLSDREIYLDIGAYRGDTVEEFIKYAGNYRKITALEPDKKSFSKLCRNTADYKNISAVNKGVWFENTQKKLLSDRGKGTRIAGSGVLTDFVSVDLLLNGEEVTYIKADAEGSELSMLKGAEQTLKKYAPKLNIAVYHRTEDFFALPLKIHQINPDYKIYLRKHYHLPFWDFNMYAVK